MTTPAQDLLALLEGAEFYVRAQVHLLLDFGDILAVESGSMRRARSLLDGMGVELQNAVASTPAAADFGLPADFATNTAVESQEIQAPSGLQRDTGVTFVPMDEEEEFSPTLSADEDTDAEGEPEQLEEAPAFGRPAGLEEIEELEEIEDFEEIEEFEELDEVAMEPLGDSPVPALHIDPEATELAIDEDYADEATVAIPDLQAIPEDSMEEDLGDPATLGDPDETEDLLREASEEEADTPVAADDDDDDIEIDDDDVEIDLGDDDIEIDDDGGDLEVEDPGEDALVTIEDTSDPRSDLDGIARGDSDLEDLEDPLSDEVVVRNSKMIPPPPRALESDMPPDEEETFVADLSDIEKMKAKMGEDTLDDASNAEVMVPRAARTPIGAGPRVAAAPRVAAGPRAVAAAGVAAGAAVGVGVSAGLYGNPNVPQIRDRNAPKPRAAAVQIDAAQEQAGGGGPGGTVLEDEEVLELGSSEDYGEEEEDVEPGAGGFAVEMQEYDEYDEEEEEEEEQEDELELDEDDVALEPVDTGPDPAEVARLEGLAAQSVEDGDLEGAIDLYSDVIDIDPDNASSHVKRGRLYLDYGDYSRAMSDFMLSEEMEPNSPEPQIAVGDLYFARKDYNRAIEHFDQALQMDPNHAMAFCRRGISHYYRKHYQDALGDLNKAQQLDSDIPNIRTYIAMAKKKAKR